MRITDSVNINTCTSMSCHLVTETWFCFTAENCAYNKDDMEPTFFLNLSSIFWYSFYKNCQYNSL